MVHEVEAAVDALRRYRLAQAVQERRADVGFNGGRQRAGPVVVVEDGPHLDTALLGVVEGADDAAGEVATVARRRRGEVGVVESDVERSVSAGDEREKAFSDEIDGLAAIVKEQDLGLGVTHDGEPTDGLARAPEFRPGRTGHGDASENPGGSGAS